MDPVAVIVDLVGSREQPDRAAAQRRLVAALETCNRAVPAVQPLAPTVGDECQGVYADLPAALEATLRLRLLLAAAPDCRAGLGRGAVRVVGDGDHPVQDGPGWWHAREALERAETLERGRHAGQRTWFVGPDPAEQRVVDAYLLGRDALVSAMTDRGRRILLGLLSGATQRELAAAEGVSPSAVSQLVRRDGVLAVLDGVRLLTQEDPA